MATAAISLNIVECLKAHKRTKGEAGTLKGKHYSYYFPVP